MDSCVSRIFQQAVQTLKSETLSFFENSPFSLVTLTKSAHVSAASDLPEARLLRRPFAGRWYIFTILTILAAEFTFPPSFESDDAGIAQVPAASLRVARKSSHLKLVKTGRTGCKAGDVQSSVIQVTPLIYMAHQEDAVRILAVTLGTVLPRYKDVIKLAAEVAKRPPPWTELSVAGLELLSVEPNGCYRGLRNHCRAVCGRPDQHNFPCQVCQFCESSD
jgi:hypothetical protein